MNTSWTEHIHGKAFINGVSVFVIFLIICPRGFLLNRSIKSSWSLQRFLWPGTATNLQKELRVTLRDVLCQGFDGGPNAVLRVPVLLTWSFALINHRATHGVQQEILRRRRKTLIIQESNTKLKICYFVMLQNLFIFQFLFSLFSSSVEFSKLLLPNDCRAVKFLAAHFCFQHR